MRLQFELETGRLVNLRRSASTLRAAMFAARRDRGVASPIRPTEIRNQRNSPANDGTTRAGQLTQVSDLSRKRCSAWAIL